MSRETSPQSDMPRYTLCLVSHSRTPPLHPEPRLKFDLRSVPNPSRALRQSMTGKHRALQKELLQDSVFCSELDRAHGIIKSAMAEFELHRRQPPKNNPEEEITEPPTHDDEEQSDVLLVGCFCAKGKHRSPAFVESLMATGEWPDTWDVKAIHRELEDVDSNQALISKNKKSRKPRDRTAKRSAHFHSTEQEQEGLWED
ncbi:hypothetical protein BFW01_g6444 [Lasiodiplodia theobromae]|uniref:Glmz-inactivating ntpase n=1 Tax=Lasiodiplodia theobromae TaxID=45133 RepID=UPI0015C3E489|nr:Glmz-inactivating ntpase [Lasiodiplodia theobromae]KAF4537933.1 Glmz-inactivating ntpase [Lasiodiplodia theobromae]KAF9635549.1 hypothetical protein BFW01_g6444 [Lasiodiplodia theobromae]